MSGSLSGHGSAWPLPTVTNAAIHAALHRADLTEIHHHRRGRSGTYTVERDRKFGSLVTTGPFPVCDDQWLFPRPLDAGETDSAKVTFHPLKQELSPSSLPTPLKYPVANTKRPSKKTPKPWWSESAWEGYLGRSAPSPSFFEDLDFSHRESSFGIGTDPETGTQDGERFYSAHYLRLKPDCHLGLLATALEKDSTTEGQDKTDLIHRLFPDSGGETPIITGGQQRICSVRRSSSTPLPLPRGKEGSYFTDSGKCLVKWITLTPAIYPKIEEGMSKRGTIRKGHSGGWLPTWICPETGQVLLQAISSKERRRRRALNYAGKGYQSTPDIGATLVAALTGKSVPVSGYALDNGLTDRKPGPKPTLLAVPAGSVYYFECDSPEDACKLVDALSWHKSDQPSFIHNRRSTLYGEKGFGLGICDSWTFHNGDIPQ